MGYFPYYHFVKLILQLQLTLEPGLIFILDTNQELLPHHDPAVYQFFLALSLCNTVQASVSPPKPGHISPTPGSGNIGSVIPFDNFIIGYTSRISTIGGVLFQRNI